MPVQINISTRHGHLSDATRAKIAGKLEKLLRVFERLTAIDVTVDLAHSDKPVVDARVSAEHKHDFVATEQSDDLFGTVDQVVHKLEQQIRKYKERVQEHHRPSALKEELPTRPGSETP